jgi:hypothetical protein
MHQVQIDIEDRIAIGVAGDDVAVPQFVVESRRRHDACFLKIVMPRFMRGIHFSNNADGVCRAVDCPDEPGNDR